MGGRILVVDDEPTIREMIGFTLSVAGFSCAQAANTAEADAEIVRERPDLILLDWMLPGQSGMDFMTLLRSGPSTSSIPVIMVSARNAEEDRVRGLRGGADDYLAKPFGPDELIARIEAVLRRVKPQAMASSVRVNGLLLDPMSHRVTADDRHLDLGPTEFRLLHVFMTHPERVYDRTQLLELVWRSDSPIGPRTVDMHVSKLRKALQPSGHDCLIQTLRGRGYRFSSLGQA